MGDLLNLIVEQAGGPVNLVILLLSLIANVALALKKRELNRIIRAVVAGVEAYRTAEAAAKSMPDDQAAKYEAARKATGAADVAKYIQYEATADGVEDRLHKLVKSVTDSLH